MNRLAPEQILKIVQIYYQNKGSVRATHRSLCPIFGRHNRPAESVVRATMNRFPTTFTLVDNAHSQRRRTLRTENATMLLWSKVSKEIRKSTSDIATIGAVPIVCGRCFVKDFAEGSRLTSLQIPTRARSEAERPSSAAHVR